jgi:hypothetical protein
MALVGTKIGGPTTCRMVIEAVKIADILADVVAMISSNSRHVVLSHHLALITFMSIYSKVLYTTMETT